MNRSLFYSLIFLFLSSCSNSDEPVYPALIQPYSISSDDAEGTKQTFEYDANGRVIEWNMTSNNPDNQMTYTAHYAYLDDNTIEVTSEESWSTQKETIQKKCFEETIKLVNGRATSSEGTFTFYEFDRQPAHKTYRLEFTYLPSNNLNVVKHSEIYGIGDNIKDDAWDNAWTWENYLIWENGNLKEFQEFNGKSSLYQTTKFDYSTRSADYPIIIPNVINSRHHIPLFMQGVFGANSANLLESSAVFDRNGNRNISHRYTYKFEQQQITEFYLTTLISSNFSNPITYQVRWIEK